MDPSSVNGKIELGMSEEFLNYIIFLNESEKKKDETLAIFHKLFDFFQTSFLNSIDERIQLQMNDKMLIKRSFQVFREQNLGSVNNSYLRTVLFLKRYGLSPPKRVYLSEKKDPRLCLYMFDVVSLIELFLNLKEFSLTNYERIFVKQYVRGSLSDICDGELLKSHKFFQKHKHSMYLLIHADDTGIGKRKWLYWRFQIGNMASHLRQRPKCIIPFACVSNEALRVNDSIRNQVQKLIFKNINRSFNEKGVNIRIGKNQISCKAGCFLKLGDNMDQNETLGLSKLFDIRNIAYSRFSLNTATQITYPPINERRHERFMEMMELAGEKKSISRAFGILRKMDSLKRLKYMNIPWSFPMDIAHDMAGGICIYEMEDVPFGEPMEIAKMLK